ncbi:MAG: hypothetical protein QOF86_4165, partial [Baekduia sp.]|nr:hypothetical protein [Baekduia sp.]
MLIRDVLPRAARAAALLLVCAAGLAPAAQAATRAPMYFDAGHAAVDDTTRDATLRRLDGLGVRALRITLVWGAVAPDAAGPSRPA